MMKTLRNLLARLRAWMAENERAHRDAKASPCCGAPAQVYAARARREHDRHE